MTYLLKDVIFQNVKFDMFSQSRYTCFNCIIWQQFPSHRRILMQQTVTFRLLGLQFANILFPDMDIKLTLP